MRRHEPDRPWPRSSGPTGLRALAAQRDGPLDDAEGADPPPPAPLLDSAADRQLPPLLRERARERELALLLDRALRAEAARHGIQVDRS